MACMVCSGAVETLVCWGHPRTSGWWYLCPQIPSWTWVERLSFPRGAWYTWVAEMRQYAESRRRPQTPVMLCMAPRLRATVAPRLRATVAPRLRATVAPRLRATGAPRLRATVAPRLRATVAPRVRATVAPRLLATVAPRLLA